MSNDVNIYAGLVYAVVFLGLFLWAACGEPNGNGEK